MLFGQPIDKMRLAQSPSAGELQTYTTKWIGVVLDVVIRESFHGYASKLMSEVETREFVCSNILLNFTEMLYKLRKLSDAS